MATPVKLSHYVLQTNDIPALRDWYLAVLGGEVVHEDQHLCFLTYDEEHHRIAFLDFGRLKSHERDARGLNHVAFAYESLGDLLGTYERLKAQGIAPHWCVNHGPTTSLYYS
ncbi:MAG: VOC family protein, partial [Stellaceae bacterium]